MITLRDRARVLENRYAFEQSNHFRAEARRNKLIGLWAGQSLGKTNPIAYAEAFAVWAVEHHGDQEILQFLQGEFAAAAVPFDAVDLAGRLSQMLIEVLEDMQAD